MPFLEALNEELKRRHSDAATVLQVHLASAIVRARRALANTTAATSTENSSIGTTARATTNVFGRVNSPPQRDWLSTFLSDRGLQQPNGHPLFRYRMNDDEYEAAKSYLGDVARSGLLENGNDRVAAIFVVCCAEWFRREATSTFRKWEALVPSILPNIPQSRHELTQRGLKFWGRQLEHSSRGREFLLTLALEGGFPVQILREGATSWLKDYLRALIRRGLAAEIKSAEDLEVVAEEEGWLVRKSYRHEDFLTLCSELAIILISLRREADTAAVGGIANSLILDEIHPQWRLELPIYVPSEDQELADALLKVLIDEKIGVLSAEGLETRRYLVKLNGRWFPAVQVLADGETPAAALPNLSITTRARAVPAGELGNHLAGELALFEPPAERRGKWRVRPLSRTPNLLSNFPFSAPVTVTLTSPSGAPQQMIWPRGEPLRSDILVFHEDDASKADEQLLRFWRSGSASSRAKTLYVLFPEGWLAEPGSSNTSLEIDEIPELCGKLAKLIGVAYFGTAERRAPRFRVATGEEQTERELHLDTLEAGFELVDEKWELAQAGKSPSIKEGVKKPRAPIAGEIFIRRPGRPWEELDGPLRAEGAIELSWRDPNANIQLEKKHLVLLPAGARIAGKMTTAEVGEITLQGFDGWSVSVRTPNCETRALENGLALTFNRRPVYRLPLSLRSPAGDIFNIEVPLKGSDAILALADGTIVQPRERLDPGRLRGGIASAPRPQMLEISCRGAGWASARVRVDGELPLGSLREAVRDMFAALPSQDDELEVSFIGDTRAPIRICRYRYEQLTVDSRHLIHWQPHGGETRSKPVVKMILDPRHEHALEPDTPPLWRIPERCNGPSLVYLRDDADVLSRPIPVGRLGRPAEFSGPLISALAVSDAELRKERVTAALETLVSPDSNAGDFNWLVAAACHLNGLPANAFDALKLLPSVPAVLIRLLLKSGGERRPIIWALQNALPFLWLSLPVTAWDTALRAEFENLVQVLNPLFGAEKATATALGKLQTLSDELIAFEPAIETIFAMAGLPPHASAPLSPLNALAGAYVRGRYERETEGMNDLAARLQNEGVALPPEICAMDHTSHAGLFAPLILAAAARCRMRLSTDIALLARRTMHEDPIYVSQAYRHLLRLYT